MLLVLAAYVFWLALQGRLGVYAGFVTEDGSDPSWTSALKNLFSGILPSIGSLSPGISGGGNPSSTSTPGGSLSPGISGGGVISGALDAVGGLFG